jgi:hypothetical protein
VGGVPVKTPGLAAKTTAVLAKTATSGAVVPAKTAVVPAKTAVMPAKTAVMPAKTAAAPARAAAVPVKTTSEPAKSALAAKAGTAVATDVVSTAVAKPAVVDSAKVNQQAAGNKDKSAPAEAAAADDGESFEDMRNKFKPAKKAVAVPAELLGDAKSYDDKLILVKLLTEKEQSRVVLMIKNMLK